MNAICPFCQGTLNTGDADALVLDISAAESALPDPPSQHFVCHVGCREPLLNGRLHAEVLFDEDD